MGEGELFEEIPPMEARVQCRNCEGTGWTRPDGKWKTCPTCCALGSVTMTQASARGWS